MPPQGTPADARANAGATWRGKRSGALRRPPDHSHLLGGCPGSVWLHGYALLDALLVVSVILFLFLPSDTSRLPAGTFWVDARALFGCMAILCWMLCWWQA